MVVTGGDAIEARGDYSRRLEDYLCRKNDGHLIRIVGPTFEMVCSWADRGVPFAIACQGIDRYFERYHAKGIKRRPVQIQFCEADVLDLFDGWRRAVGIREIASSDGQDADGGEERQRHGSLSTHLERVIARLTVLRGRGVVQDDMLDRVVRELDSARASVKGMRGAVRTAFLDRLRAVDDELMGMIRHGASVSDLEALRLEAAGELAPFRDRMPPDAYARAEQTCVDQLLRERVRLPQVAFD